MIEIDNQIGKNSTSMAKDNLDYNSKVKEKNYINLNEIDKTRKIYLLGENVKEFALILKKTLKIKIESTRFERVIESVKPKEGELQPASIQVIQPIGKGLIVFSNPVQTKQIQKVLSNSSLSLKIMACKLQNKEDNGFFQSSLPASVVKEYFSQADKENQFFANEQQLARKEKQSLKKEQQSITIPQLKHDEMLHTTKRVVLELQKEKIAFNEDRVYKEFLAFCFSNPEKGISGLLEIVSKYDCTEEKLHCYHLIAKKFQQLLNIVDIGFQCKHHEKKDMNEEDKPNRNIKNPN